VTGGHHGEAVAAGTPGASAPALALEGITCPFVSRDDPS